MSSGMELESDAITTVQRVYKKELSGCVLVIDKQKQKVVVEKGTCLKKRHKKPLRKVMKKFKDDNCRFAVVNCSCTDKDSGGDILKTACIMWCSANASVKDRMMHTSTYSAVKKSSGDIVAVQMTDQDEKNVGHVLEKMLPGKKEAIRFEGKKVTLNSHHMYEYDSSDSDTDSADESD